MKMVVAVITPHAIDAVRLALGAAGIEGMTVLEAQGYGRQKGHTEIYRGAEYQVAFLPKMRLEVVVDDGQVETVVQAIAGAANSGKIGDGKIFVLEVLDAMRVRTGERGTAAL